MFLAVFASVLLAAALAISRTIFIWILNRFWIPGLFLYALSSLVFVLFLLYVLRDASLSHIGFTLLVILSGGVLGGLSAIWKKPRTGPPLPCKKA